MMLRSAMVLAQLHAVLALAVSRAGAPMMALSGPEQLQAMNIARNLLGAQARRTRRKISVRQGRGVANLDRPPIQVMILQERTL